MHGCLLVAQKLALREDHEPSGGVRSLWERDSLLTKHERIRRLDVLSRKRAIKLTNK